MLTVPVVIFSAITLSIIESSVIFNLQKELLRHAILDMVMLQMNMLISYRLFLNGDYNVVVEYIIFFTILSAFSIIIYIKDKNNEIRDKIESLERVKGVKLLSS